MRGRDRLSNGPERLDSMPDLVPGNGSEGGTSGGDSVVGMVLLAATIPTAVLLVAYPVVGGCLLAGAVSGILVARVLV